MRRNLLIPIYILYFLVGLYLFKDLLSWFLFKKRHDTVPNRPAYTLSDFELWKSLEDDGTDRKRDGSDSKDDEILKDSEKKSQGFQAQERELVLVQVLFAHGHSSPSQLYPKDPNRESVLQQGLQQLTELGSLQIFQVGTQLRKLYQNFIRSPLEEMQCMSSSAECCKDSAYLLLASMAHTLDDLREESDLPQTVPIYYTSDGKDQFLPSSPNCYAAEVERERILLEPRSREFITMHQRQYEFWSRASGLPILTYEDVGKLFEILQIEKAMGLIIPPWAKREWSQLQYQADKWYSFRFKTRVMERFLAGPLMSLMIERMWEKIFDPKLGKKIHLYSGYQHTVAVMLQALGVFDNQMPPFGSYITLELYRRNKDQDLYDVRIRFSNATSPEADLSPPRTLWLPECTEYCPFQFLVWTKKHLLNVNWDLECRSRISPSDRK